MAIGAKDHDELCDRRARCDDNSDEEQIMWKIEHVSHFHKNVQMVINVLMQNTHASQVHINNAGMEQTLRIVQKKSVEEMQWNVQITLTVFWQRKFVMKAPTMISNAKMVQQICAIIPVFIKISMEGMRLINLLTNLKCTLTVHSKKAVPYKHLCWFITNLLGIW